MIRINPYAPFTQNQINYFHHCNNSWFNVAEGGKRGGKNVLNVLAWCSVLEKHPNKFHLASGVDQSSARINIIECDGLGIKNFFENRCRIGKFEKKDCLYIDTKAGRKIIFFAGGKKDGDSASIKGYTYGSVYITEANECHSTFVQECFDRTISSDNRKLFHDLNPKAPNNWYYKEVLEFHEKRQEIDPNYGYNWGKFTILDNLSISDEKLKRELKTFDKNTVHYERDILGNREQSQGLIYTRFANNPNKYLIEKVPQFSKISIGLDFGGAQSANAIVATGVVGNYEKLVVLASERHYNKDFPNGIEPRDIDKIAVDFVGNIIKKYGRVDYLEWDNESTFLGNGIRAAIGKAYPQVSVRGCYKSTIKNRIDCLVRLIGEDRFYWTNDAQTVNEALRLAVWDTKHEDERLDDGSTPIDDLDALEYTYSRNINYFIK